MAESCPQHFAELESLLKPVTFEPGTVLIEADRTPEAVYFVDSGLVSVVIHTRLGESIEAGFVGTEGMTAVGWALGGNPPPYSFSANVPVACRRLDAGDLRRIQDTKPDLLRRVMSAYGQHLIEQLIQGIVCARFHSVIERLARLLLVTADRLESNVMPRTHESLAGVVGAPRSAVTEAVGTLKRAGCVDPNRGALTILDHTALRGHACECFELEQKRRDGFRHRLLRQNGAGRP